MTPEELVELRATLARASSYLTQQDIIADEAWHDVLARQVDVARKIADRITPSANKVIHWCYACRRYHTPGAHVPLPADDDDDSEDA